MLTYLYLDNTSILHYMKYKLLQPYIVNNKINVTEKVRENVK